MDSFTTRPSPLIIAFDVYGTMLSTESAAKLFPRDHFTADQAKAVTALWRRYQLEYTFRLNSMGHYDDFEHVTHASLKHALRELDLPSPWDEEGKPSPAALFALGHLDEFEDAEAALPSLRTEYVIDAYVLSNGTRAMVEQCFTDDKETALAMNREHFKIVTVDDADIKAFKPARKVYDRFLEKAGAKTLEYVWLVSSNPFDVVGAGAAGIKTAWVDRSGKGWVDQLGELDLGGLDKVRPTLVADGVDKAVAAIKKHTKESHS
jgi:2-haloacid dehalogenase